MPSHLSAVFTAVLAAALTGVAYQFPDWVVLIVVLVQTSIALGPGANDDRGHSLRTPMFFSIVVGSVVSLVVSLFPEILVGAGGSEVSEVGLIDTGVFSGVHLGLVAAFITAVISQMLRKDGRDNLTRTLAHAMLMSTLAVITVGWIGAASVPPPGGVVGMAASALALAVLIRDFGPSGSLRAQNITFAFAVIAGSLAAIVVGLAFAVPISWVAAMVLGALSGCLAIIGHQVADYSIKSLRHSGPRIGFAAAMPIALVGPVAFVASALPGI